MGKKATFLQKMIVTDIPEISFTELVHLCDREEFFQQKSRELIRIYDDLHSKGKLMDEDYWEIGGIMGVCPGRTNWTECLFPWMLDLFVSSDVEGLKIEDKVNENIVYLRLLVDQLIDYLRPGQVYDLDGRTVWSQGYVRNLFRGESAYYRQSTPSLFRKECFRANVKA